MDLLIFSNTSQSGKLLLNSNFAAAASTASTLGLSDYLITVFSKTVVVNDASGLAFQAYLTGATTTNLMLFDTNESSAINYINTNYPSQTLVNFGKTNITVQ